MPFALSCRLRFGVHRTRIEYLSHLAKNIYPTDKASLRVWIIHDFLHRPLEVAYEGTANGAGHSLGILAQLLAAMRTKESEFPEI